MTPVWACLLCLPFGFGIPQEDGSCTQTSAGLPQEQTVAPSFVQMRVVRSKIDSAPVEEGSSVWFLRLATQHASKQAQWAQSETSIARKLDAMKQLESNMLSMVEMFVGNDSASSNASVHAKRAAVHNKTKSDLASNENRTLCRACVQAEQGLKHTLAVARDLHTRAQAEALALAKAAQGSEASSAAFAKHYAEFVRIKQGLFNHVVTYKLPKVEFDAIEEMAGKLYPAAVKVTKAEEDRNTQRRLEERAQAAYNRTAVAARAADKEVAAKQTAEQTACVGLGLPLAPLSSAQTIAKTVKAGQTITVNTTAGCIKQDSLDVKGTLRATGSLPLCIKTTGSFTISNGGSLTVSGADGAGGKHHSNSAGGGGGGGAVKVTASNIIIAGSLVANGGNGGNAYGGPTTTSLGGAAGPGGGDGGCGCFGGGNGGATPQVCAGVRSKAKHNDPRCGDGCCGADGTGVAGVPGGQGGGADFRSYGGGGGGGGNANEGSPGTPCHSQNPGKAGAAVVTRSELTGGSGGGGGGDDNDNEEGAGGAGAGGTIWLVAPVINVVGTVEAKGGARGTTGYCYGGAGSEGMIAYTGSLSGATNPAAVPVAVDWVTIPAAY
mmetsp:Transcript_19283/g.37870  ORF Transcript_19283/g.37870 Transcript_19283/m.37870 type:complete len:606 (-) Transcript_19283:236-2053(-)|eukprot:CAMPEP_0172710648 /NCGR_PEP_ID=MMETSP1074-20121228/56231_1 /TAXON_ID=2916 /ORGANISM="Ceratium fusus, Strain PA161109" /LENGTH=605 /DNA_ID=CAMNT_0013534105 /DNA_START=66 /DNA_END=1883 /DNA_ORIENTATION=+